MLKWSYSRGIWSARSESPDAEWRIHVIGPETDDGKFDYTSFGLFSIHNTTFALVENIFWLPFRSLKDAQEFCQTREEESHRKPIDLSFAGLASAIEKSRSRMQVVPTLDIKPVDLGLAYAALAPLVAEAWVYSSAGLYSDCKASLDRARSIIDQVTNPMVIMNSRRSSDSSEILEKHQWSAIAYGTSGHTVRSCPECSGIHPDDRLDVGVGSTMGGSGHKPECRIAAVLRGE